MAKIIDVAQRLWTWLCDHAVGRKNAKKAKVIAKALGTCGRRVQRWKAELLAAGYRVGAAKSEPHGLFVCTTAKEWKRYAGVTRRTIRAHAAGDRALAMTMGPRIAEANGQALICTLEVEHG